MNLHGNQPNNFKLDHQFTLRIIEEWLKLLQRRSKVIPVLIFLRLGLPTFCQLLLRSQNIICSYCYKLKILSCDRQDCRSKATFVMAL